MEKCFLKLDEKKSSFLLDQFGYKNVHQIKQCFLSYLMKTSLKLVSCQNLTCFEKFLNTYINNVIKWHISENRIYIKGSHE